MPEYRVPDSQLPAPQSNGTRPIGDMHAVGRSLNTCRSTVEKLIRTDADFPAPLMILNKRQWFLDEIERYKESRPRRYYGAGGVR